ncbi:bifunctional UDP-N-acetylmuramoyl-tripeptide:D-alanyl-D-alanine ligase/alanine racemase [Rhodocytophaga rosea]|uniref:Alanine racemase n=1 Tax=Rhodocytophaga rosea TaxID=2704465 RepID=A0A6C0GPH3_9BACT|nr:bifunctional UDP-N-acetylmuramoyl-tripeptide:D-alanyl-D-alanine ligase/alanine racemase [Rhodocytophaga rosea]QHT69807.1 bifunctional UDP-N-acetylmuramoyl-tripeptide:D-alanyl-D-alanine ligase/alanine racemase [Rhodocytophaga rosea]
MFTFKQTTDCIKGAVMQQHSPSTIQYLLTDSRKLITPAVSLFFAIKGGRHNGHAFIQELYNRGVRQFVIENDQIFDLTKFPEANLIKVNNSVQALQQLAACHRTGFSLPVVAITGSNGKTIVKEWLATLLAKQFNVVKSPKSYNSQIGVPLSVWQINETNTLGIFEAGISMSGEMDNLERVIRPTIGVFTNIGTAHDENFKDREQKIREKLLLFQNCLVLIYCQDHEPIHQEILLILKPEQQTFTWSRTNSQANIWLKQLSRTDSSSALLIQHKQSDFQLTIPFADDAAIENIMHCVSLMLYLEMEITEIQNRLNLLQPVSMRLELKQGINGCYLIDDTYNNDLAGLTMALDFLNLQKQRPIKTLILSDLLETGMPEAGLYQHIAQLLEDKDINRLIGIGEVISRNRKYFHLPAQFYPSTESFLQDSLYRKFSNELILLKGARTFRFENIVHKLQQKTHGTVLEINLDALAHNLNEHRRQLNSQTKIMVMVKAFAYGSGSAEVANFLQFQRIDYLAVAYADEGVILRENGIHLPIMVMNPSPETFGLLLNYRLEPELYSLTILREFIHFLKATNQSSGAHLKFDTGMHRLGFETKDLPDLIHLLQQTDKIKVTTVLSHLSAADEAKFDDFTRQQIQAFESMSESIAAVLGYMPIRHILNSAGITRFTKQQLDMVRLGIGLYGVAASASDHLGLQTVGTLKTTISQIKQVKAGETVGYSRRGKIEKDSTIATIAIGYADGFDRRLGNGVGKVWIHGKPASIVGSVCMDMTMVDITGIEATEGDEVIIFGPQHSITEIAASIGTIPYEILTGISERVKRIFFTS